MNLGQPALGLDQFINTLIFIPGDGWGMADESISARSWRCHLQGTVSDLPYRLINKLFFFQVEHCYQAWLNELNRAQLPSYYRDLNCTAISG